MMFMIDTSKKKLIGTIDKFPNLQFGHLRTPLTEYKKIEDVTVGIDNGCFGGTFNRKKFDRIIKEHQYSDNLKFITMPDILGNAIRTLEIFHYIRHEYQSYPLALVMQDGQESLPIPWEYIEAVFIGGTNNFKDSSASMDIVKTAKMLGKWVHIGRVNTIKRVLRWGDIADSCDGSGIARFDPMLEKIDRGIINENNQLKLEGL